MISVPAAFTTANAKLAKQPVYLIEIAGYNRAFSTAGASALGFSTAGGLPFTDIIQAASREVNVGGLTLFNSQVIFTQNVKAGDPIFVFISNGSNDATAGLTIDDTLSNTWVSIYSATSGRGWYAIANASGAMTISVTGSGEPHGTISGGNFQIYAVEVSSKYSGFHAAGNSGTGSPATVTAGSTTCTFTVNPGATWVTILVELAPASGPNLPLTLLYLNGATPPIPGSQIIIGALPSAVMSWSPTVPVDDWIVSLEDLKQTISDLDGSSDLSNLVFSIQDRTQLLTADLAAFVFEGKECILYSGFQGMSFSNYAQLFTGVIDTVESDNYNLEYKFTVPSKNSKRLSQVIYTTGDDGFPTDSKHTKSLNGHPLDMLVSALQQCGIALSDIDTNKIYYYRDVPFNGLSFVFSLTSAPTAKDFIENELLKPLGMYWRENNLATITISSFYPAMSGNGSYTPPTYPEATETVNTITDVPVEQIADLVDQVTFRFDENGNGFDAETVQTWTTAVNKYGLYGSHIIESKGMRSSFQGYYMAAIIARLIFLRYGGKPIILDPLPLLWSECIIEPGDIIAVTLAFLPDRQAGVMGITTKTFEVLDRNWRFMEGLCEVKLLEIDLTKFKQYLITPNAEPSYASDTAPNQAKYMYLSDSAGKYSTGAAANTLG